MYLVFWIGLGGFLGTIARYFTGRLALQLFSAQFPYGTLSVNLIGCFLIGLIYGWFEKHHIYSDEWKLILATGFCGGFTTFSAFSIENLQLLREGEIGQMLLYTCISVGIGLLATFGGLSLMKSL